MIMKCLNSVFVPPASFGNIQYNRYGSPSELIFNTKSFLLGEKPGQCIHLVNECQGNLIDSQFLEFKNFFSHFFSSLAERRTLNGLPPHINKRPPYFLQIKGIGQLQQRFGGGGEQIPWVRHKAME